jgi:hypothetical protein
VRDSRVAAKVNQIALEERAVLTGSRQQRAEGEKKAGWSEEFRGNAGSQQRE